MFNTSTENPTQVDYFLLQYYNEIAQAEFGMDYEQLGPGEQEWCQDENNNPKY